MWEILLIVATLWLVYDYMMDVCWWVKGPMNWLGVADTIRLGRQRDTILDYILTQFKTYGTTFTMKIMGTPRYIFTNNPDNVKYILKDHFSNYVKGEEFSKNLKTLLGDGIFAVDGEPWHTQRKAAAKIFHVSHFRDHMIHVFHKHLATVGRHLEEGQIDFHRLMHRFTLDSFSEIGFGESVHSLSSKSSPFSDAFDTLQQAGNEKFFLPRLFVWLRNAVTGRLNEETLLKKKIDAFSYEVIQRRLEKEPEGKDLLCHFMRMKKEDGTTYTPNDLRDIVMNFIIAGRDTTAQALSWTVYELSQQPDVIHKMRQEFAKCANPRTPTYAEVKDMTYTTAVFMECLRLHPSVPKNAKYAVQDDKLPDGTLIKKGWSSSLT